MPLGPVQSSLILPVDSVAFHSAGLSIDPQTQMTPSTAQELQFIQVDLCHIQSLISAGDPIPMVLSRCRRGLILLAIFALVLAGSFGLTLWGFTMLGSPLLRLAATAALVGATIGSLDMTLALRSKGSPLLLVLAILTFCASLFVHIHLAQARTRMIAESVSAGVAPVADIDGSPVSAPSPTTTDAFTEDMLRILSRAVPMLAFALETVGGLLLHQVMVIFFDSAAIAIRRRDSLRGRLIRLLLHVERGPWWTRERILAFLVPILAVLLFLMLASPAFSATVEGPDPLRFGYVIDLSTSRSSADVAKDVAFIGSAVSRVPLGARVVAVGVTADGFASPAVLLDSRVTADPGFMDRNLNRARAALVESWRKASSSLAPRYSGSDITGAIIRTARMLDIAADRPGFITVLSDGRQTHGLNLENMTQIPGDIQRQAREHGLLADLSGSRIAMVGINTNGKSLCYFQTLRSFWVSFSQAAHATLVAYSIDRDPNVLSAYRFAALTGGKESPSCVAPDHSASATVAAPATASAPVLGSARVTFPANHSLVNHEESIEGFVRDASARVVIVVRPKPGLEYWCSEPVSVKESGHFSSTVFFGRSPALDSNVTFQLMAIANTSACSHPGEVLGGWPDGMQSLIVEVTRR